MGQGLLHQPRILPACFDPGCLRRALDPDDAYFARAWPRTERHLKLLATTAAQDGAKFMILLIPDGIQVDRAAYEFAAQIGYDVDPQWLEKTCRTQQALLDWSRAEKIPCLDLTEHFRQSHEPLYYPQDGHFNVAGQRRTAELVADFMQETWPQRNERAPPRALPLPE